MVPCRPIWWQKGWIWGPLGFWAQPAHPVGSAVGRAGGRDNSDPTVVPPLPHPSPPKPVGLRLSDPPGGPKGPWAYLCGINGGFEMGVFKGARCAGWAQNPKGPQITPYCHQSGRHPTVLQTTKTSRRRIPVRISPDRSNPLNLNFFLPFSDHQTAQK